jgi:putative heme-binding domain-containing protein
VKSPRDTLSARSFVKEWKVEELVPIVEQGLRGGRNFERGRSIYGEVACAACHRFNQEGGSVGPELTGVVGRFSVRDMLDSIVEPSKVISDQYNAIIVTKKDGDVLTGRIANLGGSNLNLVEDMFDPGRMTNIKRSEIESIQPSPVSMMPEGLLNSLKGEEIADLIAYLFSRGDANHKSFKK